jgi:CheY-like chemotaxis protein
MTETARLGKDRPSRLLRLRVLVIDDDPLLLQLLGRLFRRLGVTMVAGAAEALALLNDGEKFDAILCDLQMPKIGGKDFFAALEGRDKEAASRTIFMSGGALTKDDEAFLEAHPSLMKPFGLKDFEEIFARLPAAEPEPTSDAEPWSSRGV